MRERRLPADPRAETGRAGERAAVRHLRRGGFKILRRNFRAQGGVGEIDIVCRDRAAGELVFVEVKTRGGTWFGEPSEAVTRAKRRRIVRAALAWLRLLDHPDVAYRFDVVEVLECDGAFVCRHIPDAFVLPEPRRP